MNNPELEGNDGEIPNATTHKMMTTSPHEFPILTISTENSLFGSEKQSHTMDIS
jgi:hypothetical protein